MMDEQAVETDYLDAMRAAEKYLPSVRTIDVSMLPRAVQAIAKLIGLPATLKLVEDFGGLTLRLPVGAREAGRQLLRDLSRSIGPDAAGILARHYAVTPLYIPNCKPALTRARDVALLKDRRWLAGKGLPERRIVQCLALHYHVSERHVWTILKKPLPPDETGQPRPGRLLDCLNR